jgi:hypothetical protein
MEEQLVSFETSKLAKEKGFSEKCNYYYQNDNLVNQINSNSDGYDEPSAPTQSFLQQWLRDEHEICVNTFMIGWADLTLSNHCKINFINNDLWEWFVPTKGKDNLTYEEALEIGLQEGLKLIK